MLYRNKSHITALLWWWGHFCTKYKFWKLIMKINADYSNNLVSAEKIQYSSITLYMHTIHIVKHELYLIPSLRFYWGEKLKH